MSDRRESRSRRDFLGGLALAGTSGLLGARGASAGAEPPPETTRLRVAQSPAICFAPQYVAGEQLFAAEGFGEVQYVKKKEAFQAIFGGEADIGASDVAGLIAAIDQGRPVVALAGLHSGCYELFSTERVRSVRDLAGKRVAIPGLHTGRHLLLSTMLAYVGLDPQRDVDWVDRPAPEAMQLLAEGNVDAFFGFPPEPQELRARRIGKLLLSMRVDRPWSEHFCCIICGNRDFVRRNPVATKRALRAILKAGNVCALDPGRAARYLVDRAFAEQYDYTVQTLKELPYGRWRDYDSAATVRFYALRMHEAKLIRTIPQKIIAQGTDWRFLNELRKELKG